MTGGPGGRSVRPRGERDPVSSERRAPQRARAGAVALPRLRAQGRRGSDALHKLAPSGRSLAVGAGLLVLAAAAYVLARQTSAFAVRSLVVRGGSSQVQAQVRRALAPVLGTSLVALDGRAVERRVEALPTVVSATYDRSFPHTLRLVVVPERPTAVVRTGRRSWLVSARGRVVTPVARDAERALPRVWLPASTPLRAGGFLPADQGLATVEALAAAIRFPAAIRNASLDGGALVFHLASGLELRLGEPADVRLKLAVARRALAVLPAGMTYLDVSLPGRPVAGAETAATNPRVSGGD